MDILKTAESILGAVAPTIATALGGPLAGMAVQQLANALGLTNEASKEDVLSAVANANPETLAKLKQIEADFKTKMRELDINLAKIAADDRKSARDRESATGDKTTKVLAFLIVILYVGVQSFLISGHIIPPEMREMVMRALGTLDATLGLVFSYYFGSSITPPAPATISR